MFWHFELSLNMSNIHSMLHVSKHIEHVRCIFFNICNIWQTCDQQLIKIWPIFDQYLINLWSIHYQYLHSIWQISGQYLINIGSAFDQYLTNIVSPGKYWNSGATPGDSHGVTKSRVLSNIGKYKKNTHCIQDHEQWSSIDQDMCQTFVKYL